MSFFSSIKNLLDSSNRGLLNQVLKGAGLGVVSASSFTAFIDYYKNRVIENVGTLDTFSGLLGLSGTDVGLSWLLSSIFASIYVKKISTGLKFFRSDD